MSSAARPLSEPFPVAPPPPAADPARLRALFDANYEFVWRAARRLGVPMEAVDDAAQEVFLVAARKLDQIRPGADRSFLFGITLRVAADARRARRRRPEVHESEADPGAGALRHAPD